MQMQKEVKVSCGAGCGRGMCPLPPKAEALGILILWIVFPVEFYIDLVRFNSALWHSLIQT